jgi:hypothetical protein
MRERMFRCGVGCVRNRCGDVGVGVVLAVTFMFSGKSVPRVDGKDRGLG